MLYRQILIIFTMEAQNYFTAVEKENLILLNNKGEHSLALTILLGAFDDVTKAAEFCAENHLFEIKKNYLWEKHLFKVGEYSIRILITNNNESLLKYSSITLKKHKTDLLRCDKVEEQLENDILVTMFTIIFSFEKGLRQWKHNKQH